MWKNKEEWRIRRPNLSQEGLKIIACISMLLDHIGALLLPQVYWLRAIGRLAFPIYCYLLAEGAYRTKNPVKYGLRLGIGAVISEIPLDFACFGMLVWQEQNVMFSLLLGFLMAICMIKCKHWALQLLVVIPFAYGAELLHTQYGALGIVLMALFVLTRNMPKKWLIQTLWMLAISWLMDPTVLPVFGIEMRVQMCAVVAMLPIGLYSGRKLTHSKWVQWAFYLFYPVHLLVLYLIILYTWGY